MESIEQIIASGMCIGCGLCESVTGGRITMKMSDLGGLRPERFDFTDAEHETLLAACPGNVVRPRTDGTETAVDVVWGAYRSMSMAWAGDAEVRFRSATGGVLTALGQHLLRSGDVKFILHAAADANAPMRSTWTVSETPEAVLAASGSRYGPVSVLAGLHPALERGEPFGIIAKPCDLNAVHGLSLVDARVDELCTTRLTMVCGGSSRLTKSQAVLGELGLSEDEVTMFRYRGYGNPGPTRVEGGNGFAHERNYLDMWADEAGWDIETRCKFCPDALGEAADIAAADAWPGGAPTGEDEGFNAIAVRTRRGAALVAAASEAGEVIVGEPVSPSLFNDFQPHQVAKKQALASRLAGLEDAQWPHLDPLDLRIDELAEGLVQDEAAEVRVGTRKRAQDGRFAEKTGAD